MSSRRDNESGIVGVLRPIASALQVITGPWTRENGASWLRLIVFVLTVWWLLIQPFRIPTDSMVPTLNGDPGFFVGDRVFVNKLAYGVRIPFTTTRLFTWDEPKRFEIVVFRSVEDEPVGDTLWRRTVNFLLPKVLIKRVIGLPGERVHIANGNVYINGEMLELPPEMKAINVQYTNTAGDFQEPIEVIEQRMRAAGATPTEIQNVREQFDRYHDNAQTMKYGCLLDEKFSVIPPGHYMVLGDNSQQSLDSRYWGWVPDNYILGRAFCVWWPIKNRKDLSGFTDTWLGLLLLWGVPGSLLGYEFIFRPFIAVQLRVRTNGLAGKLRRGDRVWVNRLAFGLRRPFSDKRLTKGRPPRRGEVVAYFVPNVDGVSYAGEALLGRLAGLPGDSITTEGGDIVVNGTPTGVRAVSSGPNRIKRAMTIPKDRYMILSDAADTAPDSRSFGLVPHELLIGSVSFVYWPPHRQRVLRAE